MSLPTTASQRPITPPTETASDQPRSATSRPRLSPEQLRVAGVGRGTATACRRPAGERRRPPPAGARARHGSPGPGRRRARVPSAARTASPPGLVIAAALGARLPVRRRPDPHRTLRTSPPMTSTRAPVERLGHVLRHGRGHEHLLRAGDERGEPVAPPGVQLGEDVVEDEHGLPVAVRAAVGAQQLVAGEPQRQRAETTTRRATANPFAGNGPRLICRSSRCGPTRLTPRSSSCERTFASASSRRAASRSRPGGSSGGDVVPERGPVGDRRLALTGGDARVGLGDVRCEQLDEPEPAGEQLGARRSPGGCPRRRGSARRPRPARIGGAGGLEQGVALAQHALVVAADPGEPGGAGDEQLVEEAAPAVRIALDEREVLGGEEHGAQRAEHLSGARDRRAG